MDSRHHRFVADRVHRWGVSAGMIAGVVVGAAMVAAPVSSADDVTADASFTELLDRANAGINGANDVLSQIDDPTVDGEDASSLVDSMIDFNDNILDLVDVTDSFEADFASYVPPALGDPLFDDMAQTLYQGAEDMFDFAEMFDSAFADDAGISEIVGLSVDYLASGIGIPFELAPDLAILGPFALGGALVDSLFG